MIKPRKKRADLGEQCYETRTKQPLTSDLQLASRVFQESRLQKQHEYSCSPKASISRHIWQPRDTQGAHKSLMFAVLTPIKMPDWKTTIIIPSHLRKPCDAARQDVHPERATSSDRCT